MTDRVALTPAQWGLIGMLVLSILLNYADRGSLSIAAPMIEKEFSLMGSNKGALFAAFFWTYALFQLFGVSGWLADRFSPAIVLACGLVIWSLGTITSGFAPGVTAIFASRLLVGAGESVAYPCYSRMFASEIPAGHRGFANALLDAGSKLGPAVGTFLGGLLLTRFGWRTFFIALGVISLLWLGPWLMWMPAGQAAKQTSAAPGPALIQLLKSRSAWGTFAGHFCGNYFWFFLLTWLPDYLVNARAFPMERMIQVTSTAFLTIAIATITAGWISDRWILSGASVTRVRKTIVCGGLAFSTIIVAAAFVRETNLAVGLLLTACAAFGAYTSNHWAITQTLAGPLAAGRWTSVQNGIGNLSGIAAAWVTGLLVEKTGFYPFAFITAAAIALTGVLMWGFVVGPVEPVRWDEVGADA